MSQFCPGERSRVDVLYFALPLALKCDLFFSLLHERQHDIRVLFAQAAHSASLLGYTILHVDHRFHRVGSVLFENVEARLVCLDEVRGVRDRI